MLRTLRSRFILSHILPLLLVVPLIGIALIYLLEVLVLHCPHDIDRGRG